MDNNCKFTEKIEKTKVLTTIQKYIDSDNVVDKNKYDDELCKEGFFSATTSTRDQALYWRKYHSTV